MSDSGARSFAVFITEICGGEIEAEASIVQQRLLQVLEDEATQRGGKASGTLTLKIKYDVDNKGNCGVNFAVEKKEPTKLRGGGVCWLADGSNYSLEPPKKKQGIREVKQTATMQEPEERAVRSV